MPQKPNAMQAQPVTAKFVLQKVSVSVPPAINSKTGIIMYNAPAKMMPALQAHKRPFNKSFFSMTKSFMLYKLDLPVNFQRYGLLRHILLNTLCNVIYIFKVGI